MYKKMHIPLIGMCIKHFGAGDGNRTHVTSLEGWNSTIGLHPHILDNGVYFIIYTASSQELFLINFAINLNRWISSYRNLFYAFISIINHYINNFVFDISTHQSSYITSSSFFRIAILS